jgi:hypothetical protein
MPCSKLLLLPLVVLFSGGVTLPGADGPQYVIQQLGGFTSDAFAQAINNQGVIVLQSLYTSGTTTRTHSYIWQRGTLTLLPGLASGGDVYACGINNSNHVVGYAVIPSSGPLVTHAVLWTGPAWTITDLGTAGGLNAEAQGISDSGIIAGTAHFSAGSSSTGEQTRVVEWTPGTNNGAALSTYAPGNPDSFALVVSASCVNNSGTIAGFTSPGGGATLWTSGSTTANWLGTFGMSDYLDSWAEVINNAGLVACDLQIGASVTSYGEAIYTWNNGVETPLPALPTGLSPDYGNGHCSFNGIDTAGDIVGGHYIPNQPSTDAALWTADGKVYDLNDQYVNSTSSSFISLISASGINDAGWIVGIGSSGSHIEPFLLTLAGAPSISSAISVSGEVGQAFTYQISANNGPTSYTATGLPTGLAVSATSGTISGTPTVAGTYSATITASNAIGTGPSPLTIIIAALPGSSTGTSASGTTTGTGTGSASATGTATSGTTGGSAGNTATPQSSSGHDCGFGSGIGVALAVIALGSLARRHRVKS